jgi:hypothetical protein
VVANSPLVNRFAPVDRSANAVRLAPAPRRKSTCLWCDDSAVVPEALTYSIQKGVTHEMLDENDDEVGQRQIA